MQTQASPSSFTDLTFLAWNEAATPVGKKARRKDGKNRKSPKAESGGNALKAATPTQPDAVGNSLPPSMTEAPLLAGRLLAEVASGSHTATVPNTATASKPMADFTPQKSSQREGASSTATPSYLMMTIMAILRMEKPSSYPSILSSWVNSQQKYNKYGAILRNISQHDAEAFCSLLVRNATFKSMHKIETGNRGDDFSASEAINYFLESQWQASKYAHNSKDAVTMPIGYPWTQADFLTEAGPEGPVSPGKAPTDNKVDTALEKLKSQKAALEQEVEHEKSLARKNQLILAEREVELAVKKALEAKAKQDAEACRVLQVEAQARVLDQVSELAKMAEAAQLQQEENRRVCESFEADKTKFAEEIEESAIALVATKAEKVDLERILAVQVVESAGEEQAALDASRKIQADKNALMIEMQSLEAENARALEKANAMAKMLEAAQIEKEKMWKSLEAHKDESDKAKAAAAKDIRGIRRLAVGIASFSLILLFARKK